MHRRLCLIATAGLALPAWADDAADYWRTIVFDQPWHLQRLLRRGLDPNTPGPDGEPPLPGALRHESWAAAAALIAEPRLDIEARNRTGETALMLAALRARTDLMRALLARGAQVDKDGWAPLHYACSQLELPPVQLLLDAKADKNARSPNGTTPLMMAARYGGIDQVRLLLARGADKTLRNDRNLSAADFAQAAGRSDELIRSLK